MDRKFFNVILLGFGFMFVFTAFQTMGNIEKTILESVSSDDPTFTGDGYKSLAIIYASLAVFNWLAPSAINVMGPRLAMVLGAFTYVFFIATFLFPATWLLYVASVVIGAGAALIWTGQGNYLTLNSDGETMARNSGVFWAMLQCSMFFGNLFVFFKFQGKTHIDLDTRNVVFSVLTAVASLGTVFLIALRPVRAPVQVEEVDKVEIVRHEANEGPLQAFKGAISLFMTREMILLSITSIYTGAVLTFFSGVYGPSIGFTNGMGENAKQLVGLSGVFIGIGEIIGGASFGIFSAKTTRWGRNPIVMMGLCLHVLSFILIFINLPNLSPFGETSQPSYITPSPMLAMFCSFLLGLGDACFNTQMYSILGSYYADCSASAFALFKFTQSMAAATSFFYSAKAVLSVQLGILLVLSLLGTATFFRVERIAQAQQLDKEQASDERTAISRNTLHHD